MCEMCVVVSCKDNHAAVAAESLRRAKFKFPGRQKIVTGRNWGFTQFSREDYVKWRRSGRVIPDGVTAKLLSNHGPLNARRTERIFTEAAMAGGRAIHVED